MKVKFYLIFIIGLLIVHGVRAQEERREICIDFRLNSRTLDSTYMDNAVRLDEIMEVFKQLRHDTTLVVTQVTFSGVASPEGNSQINQRLAAGRMEALEDYVRSHITLPDSLVIYHDDHYIPWQYLISQVESSDISHKAEVLSILRSPQKYVPYTGNTTIDSRVPALQKLDGGRVWSTLNSRFFAKMRNACTVVVVVKKQTPLVPEVQPEPQPQPEPVVVPEPAPADTLAAREEQKPESVVLFITPDVVRKEPYDRNYYLKTNAVGWGMLISNIAVEADLAKHWSATLPVYYSALNYFTSDVKFRTLCFQPEARYWFRDDNRGWFVGAHISLAWYNYAKGTQWRYQDHDGSTPLMGIGFSGGYRMPITKDHKWWMEFALGAGTCKLHYDMFYNEANGPLVDTRKRTFYGIDQVAITFAYRFDWFKDFIKKGGKR